MQVFNSILSFNIKHFDKQRPLSIGTIVTM